MTTLTNRQRLVILTLADIRDDLRFYKLTNILPEWAEDIYEVKELESIYAAKAYNLRYGIN
jgi:DUF2075 family protein